MAQVRRQTEHLTLGDLVTLSDPDTAADELLDMGETAFDEATLVYIRSDRRGMDVMRDPDVVERLYESLTRLRHRFGNAYRDDSSTADKDRLASLLADIEIERRAVRADAMTQKEIRLADERMRADTRRAAKEAPRLQASLDAVQRLRAEIAATQAKTPRARALERLRKAHEPEFLAYVREEKARDEAEGAGATVTTTLAPAPPKQHTKRAGLSRRPQTARS